MKSLAKAGLGLIIISFVTLVINDIYPILKAYFINKTIPSLFSQSPLMVIEIIALVIMIIGILLVLNERYRWTRKLENLFGEQNQEKSKYDVKKINETVYKKLMRVDCFYNIFLFGKRFWFGIPTDERAFWNKNGGNYQMWIMDSIDIPNDKLYNSIESAIPNLAIGEKYLKQHYKKIYNEWIQIKQMIIDHNKKYDDFVNYLGTISEQKISTSFPTFFSNTEVKDDFDGNVYFLKEIKETLSSAIEHNCYIEREKPPFNKKIELDSLFVAQSNGGKYWILYSSQTNGKVLMASFDKDKLDTKKLQPILCSIINDQKNTQSYINSRQYDYDKLHNKIERFTERLEKEVVHDIDAMP